MVALSTPCYMASGCRGNASSGPEKVMLIKDGVDDFRMPVHASPHRRGNRLPDLPAQARAVFEFNNKSAHGAHLIRPWRNLQGKAKLSLYPFTDMQEFGIAADAFDTFDEPLFFFPGQAEDAQVRLRIGEQKLTIAGAGTWRAFFANRKRKRLQHRHLAKADCSLLAVASSRCGPGT